MRYTAKYALILFAFVAIFTAFYEAADASKRTDRSRFSRPSVESALGTAPAQSSRSYKAAARQAVVLRNHWQPWAMHHKESLVKMLLAAPRDYPALVRVCIDLPAEPILTGDATQCGIGYCDLCTQSAVFSWQPKLIHRAKFDSNSGRIANIKPAALKQVENDFQYFHDIEISRSVSPSSPYSVAVWASGRITVSKHSKFSGVETTELQPPYSFLRNDVQKAETKRKTADQIALIQ